MTTMPYSKRLSLPHHSIQGSLDFSYERPYALGSYRNFRISVVCPNSPTLTSAPAVIFSHGGASGANYNAVKKTDWGPALASQGYIVIMITHVKLGNPAIQLSEANEQAAIISHLQLANPPIPFKAMNYVRMLDIEHMLAQRNAINTYISNAIAQIPGRSMSIDTSAGYAIAGHSAGSSAAVTAAGASRFFEGCAAGNSYTNIMSPLPKCALAYSIQGIADVDHLCNGSWSSINAAMPVLGVTGYGDTVGIITQASTRLDPYQEMSGNTNSKYQFWLKNYAGGQNPNHSFYNHSNPAYINENLWMEDVSFAFLDYFIKGDPIAGDYLDGPNNVSTDSGGQVEWRMK